MTGAFFFKTFGCQMNERDSEIMAHLLTGQGLTPASRLEDARIALVNTCHIREHAEQRALSLLGRLKAWREADPGRILAFTGCVAQAQGAGLRRRFPYVDIVLSPARIKELPGLVEAVWERNLPQVAVGTGGADVPEVTGGAPAGFKAWVKIMEGCDHHCAFCVVPFVRGPERSRPFGEIVRETEGLVRGGVVEVTLLGQTVNAYGKAAGPRGDFAALLRRLSQIDGLRRLRFTSPHPSYHHERVLEAMAECPPVCEHLHLPVQSGSDAQLKAQRRGYTAEAYLRIIDRARTMMPGLAVTTDLIVGFPGETEDDFRATLALVRTAGFSSAFSFKFSARPGTPASELADQVPEAVKEDRLARLNALLDEQSRRFNDALVGRTEEVLVEGPAPAGRGTGAWQGRLRTNTLAAFAPDEGTRPGAMRRIAVAEAATWSVSGRLAAEGREATVDSARAPGRD